MVRVYPVEEVAWLFPEKIRMEKTTATIPQEEGSHRLMSYPLLCLVSIASLPYLYRMGKPAIDLVATCADLPLHG